MAKNFNDWLNIATQHRINLEQALRDGDGKNVLYYRGKYIYSLKQAHRLNSSANLDSSVTGHSITVTLQEEIQAELRDHQSQIDALLKANKKHSNVENHTLSQELGLKIRRLATRASQVNFATGTATKKDVVADSLGLAGTTLVKAPIMASAKVLSGIGPLVVKVFTLPFTILADAVVGVEIYNGNLKDNAYHNTWVHKFSNGLEDAVGKTFGAVYKGVGKI